MQPLLNAHHVICRRQGRALFESASLYLRPGDAVALKGANGSGKSSLLRALAGLLPHEGRIEKSAAHSYIGHRDAVIADLTVAEHLRFWQGLAQNRRVIFFADILEKAGLAGFENRRASTLSAGQRQRLALCRLLIEDAKIWLLDEPASALDEAGHEFFNALLANHLAKSGAAVIASHAEEVPGAENYELKAAA